MIAHHSEANGMHKYKKSRIEILKKLQYKENFRNMKRRQLRTRTKYLIYFIELKFVPFYPLEKIVCLVDFRVLFTFPLFFLFTN